MSELAREDESSEWDWTRCRHISQSAVSQSASRSVISWSALAWYVLLLELAARYPSYRMLPSSKASFTLVSDLAHGTSHFLGLSRSTSPFQSNRSRTVKINRGCKFQLRPRRAAVLQSSQVPISRSNSGSGLGESILFWRIERLSVCLNSERASPFLLLFLPLARPTCFHCRPQKWTLRPAQSDKRSTRERGRRARLRRRSPPRRPPSARVVGTSAAALRVNIRAVRPQPSLSPPPTSASPSD